MDEVAWPLELIAAVLNGPVANAFAATRINRRDIQCEVWEAIPMPDRARLDVSRILDLVRQARMCCPPSVDTVLRIDAEILRGYDLPPRLERRLLRRFEGEDRPGVEGFRGYYPVDFDSALPLHRVLGELVDRHRANRLIEEVPVLYDSGVSDMFEQLFAGFDG